MGPIQQPLLPPDDALRRQLHDEVHARPPARIALPAAVLYVALFNDGVSRQAELDALRQLPGQGDLCLDDLQGNFLRLMLPGYTLKWERHTEFTRYSVVQSQTRANAGWFAADHWGAQQVLPPGWLARLPGRTFCAIELALLLGDPDRAQLLLAQARDALGEHTLAASVMGNQSHSLLVTDFKLRDNGFERMLVYAAAHTSETRAGRIAQRLLEVETYRLMALRGLPVAKALGPELALAEAQLAQITADLEHSERSDQALLDALVTLAAGVEKAIALHSFRFSATRAYHNLVEQRIAELREAPIPGTQTLGEFMRRRLAPAMATVAATELRLNTLSERVSRASALLRTRVDIATEGQNQQLLEKLTRGQAMQLRLQSTVEGLSIAAISYYIISLLLYGAKAIESAGVPIQPNIAVGALIPVVLYGVWRTVRRIHQKLHAAQ